ncbi:MAG: hypothetical protein Hyperionvirus10_44 [Hyperionvirus sp.]|uniref:Uncharacterized protein n=1 Tax=Hyperionvirus sp. TaxID=2487770 RepID=A0A3G5A8X6_9VIRU|nr:MAG: hypothetical protein Hyperionvirus10_44 [Hyperionvirus sp.]
MFPIVKELDHLNGSTKSKLVIKSQQILLESVEAIYAAINNYGIIKPICYLIDEFLDNSMLSYALVRSRSTLKVDFENSEWIEHPVDLNLNYINTTYIRDGPYRLFSVRAEIPKIPGTAMYDFSEYYGVPNSIALIGKCLHIFIPLLICGGKSFIRKHFCLMLEDQSLVEYVYPWKENKMYLFSIGDMLFAENFVASAGIHMWDQQKNKWILLGHNRPVDFVSRYANLHMNDLIHISYLMTGNYPDCSDLMELTCFDYVCYAKSSKKLLAANKRFYHIDFPFDKKPKWNFLPDPGHEIDRDAIFGC